MDPSQFDLSSLPGCLHETVRNWLSRSADKVELAQVVDADPALQVSLPRVIACSPYIGDVLERYPGMLL